MALKKLVLNPGVNRDQTNYANEGGWYECNKIRFFSGFPQKIGGWTRYSSNAFVGACRALFNWVSTASTTKGNYLAIGTSSKIYVEYATTLQNITPLRLTNPSISIASITTVGPPTASNVITVTFTTTHAATVGNYVCLAGITGTDVNGIPVTTLNSNDGFKILSIPTTSSITINVGAYATASGTVSPPAGTPVGYFEIDVGAASSLSGYGWGIPAWGGSTTSPTTGWGTAALSPAYVPLQLVYFDKDVDNLYFNIRYGNIYKWPLTNIHSVATRAEALQNFVGSSDVPLIVTQVMFDSNANILMAFGCEPYESPPSTVQDPLLVRWASQANLLNWTPTDDPGISTAGYLRIQNGSQILRAVSNSNEILVLTESAITSLSYVGTFPLLFTQKLVSSDITVISANAVIVVNNVVYWMGHDKFFSYNGRVEVIPTTLREEVFGNIDYSQSEQFFACSNERFNEIWWFYKSNQGATTTNDLINRYVIYNYIENIWYYGDCENGMVRNAWIDSALRPFPQAAAEDGYIYNHENGVDANGEALPSFITSSDIDIEDGDKFSLIRRIIPDISFNGSDYSVIPVVNMTLYPRNFPGQQYFPTNQEGQILERPAISLLVNQYTEQMFVRTRARQLGIKISSEAEGTTWQLGAPRIDLRADGTRGYNNPLTDIVYWYSSLTDGADTAVANAVVYDPPPAPSILYLDASNSSSWTTDTPTTFQNWVDLSGNSWSNQLQIVNAVAGATLVDLNNTPTTVAASGTKGLRLQATTGGTYPNGTSVQQRGEWSYGSTATPGDPAYSLYTTGTFTFAFWIKFNVAPISGSGAFFSWPGSPTTVLAHVIPNAANRSILHFACNNADTVNPRSSSQMSFGYFDNVGAVAGVNYTAAGTWTPSVGVWYNVVLLAQNTSSVAGTLYLYVNGALQGSATLTGSGAGVPPFNPSYQGSLSLNTSYNSGASPNQYDYGGDITYSTLKIWNTAITATNVTSMWNLEKGNFGY